MSAQTEAQPTARPLPTPKPSPNRRRILVADDESRIRLVLRTCLEAEGYEVFEAADGLEALETIIRTAPDLMILDLAMPNLDGLRTIESLSGVHGQLKPRVIVLTAWGSGPAMLKTMGMGASMFMEKPVTPPMLLSAVKQVLAETNDSRSGIPIDWSAVLADEEENKGN
jgi:DNA-binding response OmpR family regulator